MKKRSFVQEGGQSDKRVEKRVEKKGGEEMKEKFDKEDKECNEILKDTLELMRKIREGETIPFGTIAKIGLDLRNLNIDGDYHLYEIAIVKQKLDLSGSTVKGRLSLTNMIIDGFLNLEKINIKSTLYLIGITVTGNLILKEANIGGHLELANAMIGGDLNLEDAIIGEELDLRGINIGGNLNLTTKKRLKRILVSETMAQLVHFAAPTVPLIVDRRGK